MLTIAGRRIRLGLTLKLVLVADMALNIFIVYVIVFALPQMQRTALHAKEAAVEQQAEVAWGILQYNHQLETSGLATRSEAQQRALDEITSVTSGQEDHFWVCDYRPILLAGAALPERLNTDVSTVTDAKGQALFADMVGICANEGEGLYRYSWESEDGSRTVPTVCYVKSFQPWGWAVSTGTSIQGLTGISASQTAKLGWLAGLTGVLALILFWLVVRTTVLKPLSSMVKVSENLAKGDVDQEIRVKSNDEIGDMAAAYSKVVDYVKDMARLTTRIADGDLSVQIKPRSDRDILSHAYHQMITRQRELIGGVKAAAAGVAEASEHLSRASEQTARVTQQITNAIQQVAKGTGEQSASLQEIVLNEQKLAKAIEQMASGSQEQAASAEEAARMVKQVSMAVAQVLQNAQAGTEAWKSTANSAETGARTTYEAVEGMKRIKEAMDLVSLRVADLGERSQEIGSIVATIDDIAAQTNLLALNAAIEAARAGEQGRGFAVVADEVRKLAERASTATKEIASLISNIQNGVLEAVRAMERGGREVETGYGLATQAGKALDDILERAQVVGKQVHQISAAAQELNALSSNMVSVIQQISRTIDENAAAAEIVAQSSSLVSGAIENVGGVAEENSASAEEVSASTEEMSAGVEEVLASAQALAEMAEGLEKSVAAFKTDTR
ncbi:MAG: methyl-accepting chemotaxis protein [Dehalococcoidia bacterium]|nr:methyl-accepting chemotaxis protein [Dehalococcoidia bacterium]